MKGLRLPGSILLISCYELGHQPLGIAMPLGFLESAGYLPEVMDISVESLDTEKIAHAHFIGISVPMHTALRLGVHVAQRIREVNPACHICFYGLYASLNADYLLSHGADSIIGGEYEAPLVALVDALESGSCNEVAGVSRPGKKKNPFLERLSFVLPDRSSLPSLTRYAQLENNGSQSLVGYVEASRGCLHHCLHCPIPPVYNGRFFVVPKEVILEDISRLVRSGARHITFGDPDFLNGPTHSLRIVREMHSEFPEITFDFTAKVEHILKYRSLFPELGHLGCIFMISAVESLSDTVLANLEKGHTQSDIYEALNIVREAGIALRPTWVAFTPWTSFDDYINMLEFVSDEDLVDHVDPVQYTIRLLIPPRSSLLSQAAMKPFLGSLDPDSFLYHWKHPDSRMDILYQKVRAIVERAGKGSVDPAMTFDQIRTVAYLSLGKKVPALMFTPFDRRNRPPRLTEPWFCCAEPTGDQFHAVGVLEGV